MENELIKLINKIMDDKIYFQAKELKTQIQRLKDILKPCQLHLPKGRCLSKG